jgi:hypothetical protein
MMGPPINMLARLFAVLMVGVVVVACAAQSDRPLPTDKVKDAAAAIEIGKQTCVDKSANRDKNWTATFQGGVWTAKHVFPNGYPKCNWEQARFPADTGVSDFCEVCVVT